MGVSGSKFVRKGFLSPFIKLETFMQIATFPYHQACFCYLKKQPLQVFPLYLDCFEDLLSI